MTEPNNPSADVSLNTIPVLHGFNLNTKVSDWHRATIDFEDRKAYPDLPPSTARGPFIDWLKQVRESPKDVLLSWDRVNTAYLNAYPKSDGLPCPDAAYIAESKQVNLTKLLFFWNWHNGMGE